MIETLCDQSHLDRKRDLNGYFEKIPMKTSKRDSRKPEMAIYRPGMGLHNKTNKCEDRCDQKVPKSTSPSENCILEQLNTLELNDNEVQRNSHEITKSSKNNKNRRPDIQVYTPKPKIAAQLNNKKTEVKNGSQPPVVREESVVKSRGKKSPVSYLKENSEVESKASSRRSNSKSTSRSYPKQANDSHSPLPLESSGDVVDSDVSNARSSPDKLCNGINDVDTSHAKDRDERHRKQKSRHRSNNEGRKHSASRNSKRTDDRDNFSPAAAGNTELSKSKERLDNCQFASSDKLNCINYSEKERKSKQKFSDLGVRTAEEKGEKFSKEEKHESAQSRNSKKRNEQTLPPRFQKNKNQSQDNHPNASSKYNNSSGGSGGLLKLPVNYDQPTSHSEPVDNSIYVPKMYHEPQVFIHKTLFDPNNPNKPEIVNIPAPHPPPHMPYSNMNNDYFSPEISYIQQSVQSMGYIPPPQPPAMNRQYYGVPDVKMNITPDSYLNRREIIPPPIPNSVYCPPSLPFAEMPPVPPEGGKKKLKPAVERYLGEIAIKERELSVLLTKGLDEENFHEIQCCRFRLQSFYEKIILAHPTYCAERNPEQSLWKTTFHHIIELCRKKLEENPSDREAIKEKLLDVINQGTHFCRHLIEQMEEKYDFDLAKLLESDTVINMSLIPEKIRVVFISVQKLHVYLGDLARYKEQVNQTSNFGKARSYYQKASQMLPKNGRPYYQLALVSVSTRRKLDAVYFYIRSLSASNPILSAKESLLTLFDEVKRKYEMYEKKRIQEIPNDVENLDKNIGKRVEVWIKPDGSSNHRPAEMDNNLDSSDIKNLSDAELNKRFVTSFLHVHGKLFTKVGMETFPDTLNQMLKEFYFLLQRTPLPITSSRLMQLIAINIFSVDNSSSKENGREHGGFSLLQEQALYTSMAMMSILMERCHMLHIAHKSSPEFSNHMLSDDLAELLPSVKIWTDWMSCQKCFWPSPPSSVLKELNIGFAKNIWSSFADLLTILREVDMKYPNTSSTQDPDCETLILEEDNSFAGFVPLLGALQDPIYVRKPFDKVSSKHAVRINRIQFFGDYLCGITPPCMQFDVENKKFVPLVDQVYSEESFEGSVLHNSFDDIKREEDIGNNLRGRAFHENDESNELQILWSKKEALSKTKEQQEKYKAEVQAVLQKHQSQRSTVLKIKPKYLIPDTNCFIDHLRLFRNILALSNYNLIVPLVVINELDGLARGTRVNEHTSPEHANRVTILSREAIRFLEEQFAQKNPHIKAITSKGSILDTISFRSEEMGKNKGTNDDLILSCCLYYCKDRAEEFMPKIPDDPVTLFREVVLLTDDRNLRVKALAHHVPVRDLQSFLQWVNS